MKKLYFLIVLLLVLIMGSSFLTAEYIKAFAKSGTLYFTDGTKQPFFGIDYWGGVWEYDHKDSYRIRIERLGKDLFLNINEVKEVVLENGRLTSGNPGTYILGSVILKVTTKNGKTYRSRLVNSNKGVISPIYLYLTENDFNKERMTDYKSNKNRRKYLDKVIFHKWKNSKTELNNNTKIIAETFSSFFEKFKTEKSFQISRTKFPLKYNSEYLYKNKWKALNFKNGLGTPKIKIKSKSHRIVIFNFNAPVDSTLHFKKVKNNWFFVWMEFYYN